MPQGVIATIPKFQFSANGVPMVGGTLETYIAGSTTPATTWQDSALTIANTNPISLDARGECVLWLDSTKSYKFVLKNAAGVTQWTQDNISGGGSLADRLRTDLSASSGASLVGFQQEGTGAVSTTVQSKLREIVSVKDFGAVGNGVTDDTAAIQNAITAARAMAYVRANGITDPTSPYFEQSSTLYFPPGRYLVTSSLWFGIDSSQAGWTSAKIVENVIGDGAIIIGRTAGKPVIDMSGAFGMRVRGLSVFGDGTSTPNVGILLARSGTATVNPSAGLHRFTNVDVHGDFTLACVYNYASEINNWVNCYFYQNSGKTVYLATNNNARHAVTSQNCTIATTAQSAYGDFFTSCDLKSSTGNTTASGAVVYLESTDYGPVFIGCYIDTSGAVYMPSIFLRNALGLTSGTAEAWSQGVSIIGCTFEYRTIQDIIFVDADHVVIDLTIRGCKMPIDTSTGNRAHISITTNGTVKNLDAQRFSGDTNGSPFIVAGGGTLQNPLLNVVPMLDAYIGTGWLYTEGTLNKDGTWYTIDLSVQYGVPKTAKFVAVKVVAKSTAVAADNYMALRGSSADSSARWMMVTPAVNNIEMYAEGLVPVSNGQIQYSVPANFNMARILIREYHI